MNIWKKEISLLIIFQIVILRFVTNFEKSEGNEVRIRAENPRNYPPDKYAKLQIYDSNNNIYKSKKTTTTISLEIFYTFLLFYCIYLLSNRFLF